MNQNPLQNIKARTATANRVFSTTDEPKYPHIYVNLQDVRAHSLCIVALTNRALRHGGVSRAFRDKYMKEALRADMDHAVMTTMKWVSWQEFLEEDFCRMVEEEAAGLVDTNFWIEGRRTDFPIGDGEDDE